MHDGTRSLSSPVHARVGCPAQPPVARLAGDNGGCLASDRSLQHPQNSSHARSPKVSPAISASRWSESNTWYPRLTAAMTLSGSAAQAKGSGMSFNEEALRRCAQLIRAYDRCRALLARARAAHRSVRGTAKVMSDGCAAGELCVPQQSHAAPALTVPGFKRT